MNTVNLALRLTLLGILLHPIGNWFLQPIFLGTAALGVALPHHLRRPFLWMTLFFLALARVLFNWPMADNHAYLLCYWCLASLEEGDDDEFVGGSGA
jgi:hypothetical protein